MAFVKVKVDALEQQKKEYEKAIKSLDGALEQIKKVNASTSGRKKTIWNS